jgi:hypothetical protein
MLERKGADAMKSGFESIESPAAAHAVSEPGVYSAPPSRRGDRATSPNLPADFSLYRTVS